MAEILVVGAGAIGGPLAAWLADAGHAVRLHARGATAEAIERDGIRWYASSARNVHRATRVEVIRELRQDRPPSLAIVAVKSAALGPVLDELKAAYGDALLVVGVQNGIEVLRELPRRFRRSALAIVHWNAWVEAPGAYGIQRRGSIVLAPLGGLARDAADELGTILESATPVVRAERARDAALCKMVVNLTGSLQALTGFHRLAPDDPDALQRLLGALVAEGVSVVRAAGAREVRVPGTPSWIVLLANARLPPSLTRGLFRRNLAKMRISSLAQDLERGVPIEATELDSIHGELLRLADAFGVPVPLLRLVHDELLSRAAAPRFEPKSVRELAREAGLAGPA